MNIISFFVIIEIIKKFHNIWEVYVDKRKVLATVNLYKVALGLKKLSFTDPDIDSMRQLPCPDTNMKIVCKTFTDRIMMG